MGRGIFLSSSFRLLVWVFFCNRGTSGARPLIERATFRSASVPNHAGLNYVENIASVPGRRHQRKFPLNSNVSMVVKINLTSFRERLNLITKRVHQKLPFGLLSHAVFR